MFVYVRDVCRKDIEVVHKKLKDLGVGGIYSPIDYHLHLYADVYGVVDNSISLVKILNMRPGAGYRVYTCHRIPKSYRPP